MVGVIYLDYGCNSREVALRPCPSRFIRLIALGCRSSRLVVLATSIVLAPPYAQIATGFAFAASCASFPWSAEPNCVASGCTRGPRFQYISAEKFAYESRGSKEWNEPEAARESPFAYVETAFIT